MDGVAEGHPAGSFMDDGVSTSAVNVALSNLCEKGWLDKEGRRFLGIYKELPPTSKPAG